MAGLSNVWRGMGINIVFEIFGFCCLVSLIFIGLARWWGGILSKRIIQNEKARLDKELKREEARLSEELEEARARLQEKIRLAEIRFNSINEERLKALVSNYQLLADTWLVCRWAIQPDEIGREKPVESERLEKAAKLLDSYVEDFERKKLFMSDYAQNSINEFITSNWHGLNGLRVYIDNPEKDINTGLQELYEGWIHEHSIKMTSARRSIEKDYKNIIGVSEHDKFLLDK